MSADGGDNFVRKRVFFYIKSYTDILQILRKKIIDNFLVKNVCNCCIFFYIFEDSSVRRKYNRRVLLIVIIVFG